MTSPILLGKDAENAPALLERSMLTRHGLISGATGTGKTVSLQRLAEECAAGGSAVFLSDVKGDLSGLGKAAQHKEGIQRRLQELGIEEPHSGSAAVSFLDIFGERGVPVRTTVSEVGPLLLAHMLELNETQEGVLHVVFEVADREGLLLLDLKDLGALLTWVAEHHAEVSREIGQVHPTSIGSIQRKLLVLKESGGEKLFGEPAFDINDLLVPAPGGAGMVHILDARRLIETPRLYGAFLLWLLSELFETLPEVGDVANPKLVFFFDEAHLLFSNATPTLLDRIAQVVRLIRSKGVGVFFVSQHPLDIDEKVLTQLGNRVQHALRAFTPQEQKRIRTVGQTFPNAAGRDLEQEIMSLGVGEAVVSFLTPTGVPGAAAKVRIIPPRSQIGAIQDDERARLVTASPLCARYMHAVDRESAYEVLAAREAQRLAETGSEKAKSKTAKSTRQSGAEAFFKSMLRSVGNTLGREIVRGILGSLPGVRRR